MLVPAFISAEAAVKSKDLSIFDPAADLDTQPLKRFYADPDLVRDAVNRLKEDGFSVLAIGRMTISISASPNVFEKAFGIKLNIGEDPASDLLIRVENSAAPGFIDTSRTTYSDLLAGVLLMQPIVSLGNADYSEKQELADDFKKKQRADDHIFTEDLLEKLGGNPDQKVSGKDQPIHIVDTGVYKKHPAFKNSGGNLTQNEGGIYLKTFRWIIKVNTRLYEILSESRKIIRFLDKKSENDKKSIKEKVRLIIKLYRSVEIPLAGPEIIKIHNGNLEKIQKLEKFLGENLEKHNFWEVYSETIKELCKNIRQFIIPESNQLVSQLVYYKDPSGHGTQMVGNCFALAPDSRIRMHKIFSRGNVIGATYDSVKDILEKTREIRGIRKKCILSYSHYHSGSISDLDQASSSQVKNKNLWKSLGTSLNAEKSIILICAGNASVDKGLVSLEAYALAKHPNVIVVGGAYKNRNDKFVYSSSAHGYAFKEKNEPKQVPDICGWCGEYDTLFKEKISYLWSPIPPVMAPNPSKTLKDGYYWHRGIGTSQATAQIAGVCALIWETWPDASPQDIKKILRMSATPIIGGETAQGFVSENSSAEQKIDLEKFDNKKLKAGMVNIEKAIFVAKVLSDTFSSVHIDVDHDKAMDKIGPAIDKALKEFDKVSDSDAGDSDVSDLEDLGDLDLSNLGFGDFDASYSNALESVAESKELDDLLAALQDINEDWGD